MWNAIRAVMKYYYLSQWNGWKKKCEATENVAFAVPFCKYFIEFRIGAYSHLSTTCLLSACYKKNRNTRTLFSAGYNIQNDQNMRMNLRK